LAFDDFVGGSINKENMGDKVQSKLFKSKAKKVDAKTQSTRQLFPNLFLGHTTDRPKESLELQDDSLLVNSPKSDISVVLDKSPCQVIDSAQKEIKHRLFIEPEATEKQLPFQFKGSTKSREEESQEMLSRLLMNTIKNKDQTARERQKKNGYNAALLMSDSKETNNNFFCFK
jgi:hypothetical protein